MHALVIDDGRLQWQDRACRLSAAAAERVLESELTKSRGPVTIGAFALSEGALTVKASSTDE
jgi:hypothetical protein